MPSLSDLPPPSVIPHQPHEPRMPDLPGSPAGALNLIANAGLWISFFLYLIYFVPQLYGNIREPDRMARLALLTVFLYEAAAFCDVVYATSSRLPFQYVVPPVIQATGLFLQELQLVGSFRGCCCRSCSW